MSRFFRPAPIFLPSTVCDGQRNHPSAQTFPGVHATPKLRKRIEADLAVTIPRRQTPSRSVATSASEGKNDKYKDLTP